MHSRQISSLLKLADQGNDSTYADVIVMAAGRLERLARRMLAQYPDLQRWEQTSDVVQNASIRLHRSLERVRPDSMARFLGLASTEIRRTLIDLARHHFGPEGFAANHQSDVQNAGGGATGSGATQPASLEDWTRFHEAIGQLPDEEREVFELVWYAGLEQTAISDVIGQSVRTVKRRWRSAKMTLYETLGGVSPLAAQNAR